jgi:membrane associated rhomboid family serine protease
MRSLSPVVKNILIINILLFIITLVVSSSGIELERILGVYYFDSPNFKVWQIITYMFMHGGIMHIFFNMFALYMFGSTLEAVWGSKRFFNFYMITGIGALFLQMVVQAIEMYFATGNVVITSATNIDSQNTYNIVSSIYNNPMVGASGAIFGLLIAFGMLFPNTELILFPIPIPVKAKYFVVLYIVLELYLGLSRFSGDSVAHFAHLGGALFGFILVKYWNRNRFKRF